MDPIAYLTVLVGLCTMRFQDREADGAFNIISEDDQAVNEDSELDRSKPDLSRESKVLLKISEVRLLRLV